MVEMFIPLEFAGQQTQFYKRGGKITKKARKCDKRSKWWVLGHAGAERVFAFISHEP